MTEFMKNPELFIREKVGPGQQRLVEVQRGGGKSSLPKVPERGKRGGRSCYLSRKTFNQDRKDEDQGRWKRACLETRNPDAKGPLDRVSVESLPLTRLWPRKGRKALCERRKRLDMVGGSGDAAQREKIFAGMR